MTRWIPLVLWLALGAAGHAAPKVAMVRVGAIYQSLDATQSVLDEVEAEEETIRSDERIQAYRKSLEELGRLQGRLAEAGSEPEAVRERLRRDFLLKRQEAVSLRREAQSFREKRRREINEERVRKMKEILTRIHRAAEKVGREKGYDWVIDSSGKTNTGLPFVLYSRESDDITSLVRDALAEPAGDASN